jgi:2-methylisocitrate lyase-like PEP mutase family enzyme
MNGAADRSEAMNGAADRSEAMSVRRHAETLRALHVPGRPVVLPNVWDVASAAIVAATGFPAVATSSAAIAESLGYVDGGGPAAGVPPEVMFAAVERVAAAVDIPVTADVERGYGLWPEGLVSRLIRAGVAGCNVEDSAPPGRLVDAAEQADFIAALRAAAERFGVPLVINARVDVFLTGAAGPEPVEETIARGRRYLAAGADCVFPILAPHDAAPVLLDGIGGPVNLLCRPGDTPSQLAELGAARVSYGPSMFHNAMAGFAEAVRRIAG